MESGQARGTRLVGFCGYAGSGKDSCADLLVSKLGYEKRSFAAPLRSLALHLNPLMMIEDPKRLPKGQVVLERYANLMERDGYEATKRAHEDVRLFLVALGHGARQALGEDMWLDAALPVTRPGLRLTTRARRSCSATCATRTRCGASWASEASSCSWRGRA